MQKKYIKIIIVAVVLLAGGFYLYQNLGGMITRTAEKIASDALGVRVNIGSIHVSLSDKKVSVNKLEIGNPPGYRHANAVTADEISIGLNTASRQLIDFNDIAVKGSEVNLEVNEKGMNLVDLKNLANSKKQKESVGSEQVRVIVKHMVIEASTINPSVTFLDRDIPSIKMPAISFSNLGQGGGMNAGKALVQVLTKYLSEVQKTVQKDGLLDGITVPGLNDAQKSIDGATEKLKGLFQ